MRIEADLERCVGAGQCVLTAPARFDQNDEDGRVVVLQAEVDEAGAEVVREAVTVCPSQALALVEQ
ncbi:Ferredoxin [Saccharopolyspora kobensis]|uniref:Ferredoxin n=1 Tax=Saccharopolyspora kobensis TaxID=146035 RepID=A0A1H5XFN5_9PSEU|nr:ferredoxin [Saccharopolyspora kobensis]SEG10578.1 Ferredoxin [Saccharopolyspora kobensis]SFE43302.1 ferredoxin [Saccharopolyspora kobensis]